MSMSRATTRSRAGSMRNGYEQLDLEAQISHLSDESGSEQLDEYFQRNQPVPMNSKLPAHELVYSITTSGTENEYIHIDDKKFLKDDLLKAFGGNLNPGYAERPAYKFGNPAPLGLSAFALTTFVLSLINVQARGVTTPNIVTGLAFFYGGVVQLLAGMWELAVGNAFGGTALSSYGGFWLSFGAIYVESFGIASAYKTTEELENAVGFYLLGWAIFTGGLTLLTMKSTLAFFLVFFDLTITFILLAAGKLAMNVNCTKAGGVTGVICAFLAWYCAYAGLSNQHNSYIVAKAIPLPQNIFGGKKKQ
ncbi:CYFA0S21e02102g1_1 [Cyberlindnera fabianii]|uniref:Ammonia transport outward protein 2 n=1 Tax=Cyberlindnera fabianii TaxID=36022 RepID=A0A061B9R1_CYBFA|nr:Ammonia transport outward protein 2 [Cyberlindnera fabianii]CDR46071.1 CYFA0S21e02102g1_1 [Cyberlindnera fabianii]